MKHNTMNSKEKYILIVDDEKNTRDGLERALKSAFRVLLAENAQRALDLLSSHPVDLALLDVRMPGMDGMSLLQRMRMRYPQTICIMLTAYGSIETAVTAMKKGANDYLTKPVNLDDLEIRIERALRSRDMETENQRLRAELAGKYGLDKIIGQSPPMQQVFDVIRQVAPTRATVLIHGESGTGKELAAHAIHHLSPRVNVNFIAVHCAALAENLLESELFGHEKGAFTGAFETKRGRFELADGGTLFLDEVGEIDTAAQVKLLRVLEERRFERVGGQRTIETDVRLLAATNRDLKQMVAEGSFREDLYYRLNVIQLRLPPLRERPGDIGLLLRHFLDDLSAQNNREVQGLDQEAMDILINYAWPGNVRELRNVIESMVVLSRGPTLTVDDIPSAIRENAQPAASLKSVSELSLMDAEKQLIISALKTHNGNRTEAAKHLGVSRRTLHRKLNEYGLRDSL